MGIFLPLGTGGHFKTQNLFLPKRGGGTLLWYQQQCFCYQQPAVTKAVSGSLEGCLKSKLMEGQTCSTILKSTPKQSNERIDFGFLTGDSNRDGTGERISPQTITPPLPPNVKIMIRFYAFSSFCVYGNKTPLWVHHIRPPIHSSVRPSVRTYVSPFFRLSAHSFFSTIN